MSAIVAVIEFKGKSEKIYAFNVFPLNEECLQQGGVYVFTKRSLNSCTCKYEHNVFFIGSGEAIPNQLYNDQKKYCINQNAANSVCFMAVYLKADRLSIEQDLLKAHITLCNEAKGLAFL